MLKAWKGECTFHKLVWIALAITFVLLLFGVISIPDYDHGARL